jgi:hypothetical protein
MEFWKPLRNFPSYNGSTEGRIMNVRTQHILKPYIGDKGYPQVSLCKNNKTHTVRIGRVIADTFLGEHPDLDVRYRDNDRLNTRVENLYYSTRKETINDAFVRGTKKPSRGTAIRIVETGEEYRSASECAREIGCDRSAIFKCLAGTTPHVKGYHFERV